MPEYETKFDGDNFLYRYGSDPWSHAEPTVRIGDVLLVRRNQNSYALWYLESMLATGLTLVYVEDDYIHQRIREAPNREAALAVYLLTGGV